MSEQQIPHDESSSAGATGPAGGDGGTLRDRLAAVGERLDHLVDSPEVREARQRLARAADDLEGRLREAQVGERLEQGINDLSQRLNQYTESPRGKEIGDRLTQAFSNLQQEIQRALESQRGQELRGRLSAMLRDWSAAVEGKRGGQAGPVEEPAPNPEHPKD